MQEAKHGIFSDCLRFKDFKNFDGVRFAYKGVWMVAFKVKEAIDVDELIPIQHFSYKQKIKRNNSVQDQVIKCKVKGFGCDKTTILIAKHICWPTFCLSVCLSPIISGLAEQNGLKKI